MLRIFKKHKRSAKKELRELLGGYEVPSFSATVMGVLNVLRDPESTLTEIAEQIGVDPGMHVNVLRTVNSAAFGLSTEVTSIEHAISLLGRSRLESLVLSVVVQDSLPRADESVLNMHHFWLAAAKRASLARALAVQFHPTTQSECFSVGLLQDMAVPVLAAVKKDAYRSVYQQWQSDPAAALVDLEKETFGYDHATIGALMIAEWDLPEYLAEMVSGHHRTNDERSVEPAIRVVSLIRDSDDLDGAGALIQMGRDTFGLAPDEMETIVNSAFADAEMLARILEG